MIFNVMVQVKAGGKDIYFVNLYRYMICVKIEPLQGDP